MKTIEGNFKNIDANLIEVVSRKSSRNPEKVRRIIRERLRIFTLIQRPVHGGKSGRLTEYANHLLETDFKELYNLIYNYSDSRMTITHIKHSVLEVVKKKRLSNVKLLLKEALISAYNQYRISGAMRTSDRNILNRL